MWIWCCYLSGLKKNQNQIKTQKQQQKKAKTKQTVKLLILLAHQRLAVSG